MTISSRFAQTHIEMEVVNDRDDWTALASFTFQLPINARVTDMTMTTTPGDCQKTGVVKEIMQAEQEFVHQAMQGQSAALLKAYDSTQYGISLSLPPAAITKVEIHLEELLHRYRGQVDFQVPIYAGLEVQKLTLDITIQEPQSGVARFAIERSYDNVDSTILNNGLQILPSSASRPVASAFLEATGVPASTNYQSKPLPSLLRGYYDPGPLPPDGLLLSDPRGTCYVHLFNPDSLLATAGSLPRNIVFVIDVSGSMQGQKLQDAKAAFAAIIDKLTSDDYFAVQTFANEAVQNRFGPYLATDDVKVMARDWVNNQWSGGGTNLEGAYLQGLGQVESMQLESEMQNTETTFVPVLVILTDGEPTNGETYPPAIARNVRIANGNHNDDRRFTTKILVWLLGTMRTMLSCPVSLFKMVVEPFVFMKATEILWYKCSISLRENWERSSWKMFMSPLTVLWTLKHRPSYLCLPWVPSSWHEPVCLAILRQVSASSLAQPPRRSQVKVS